MLSGRKKIVVVTPVYNDWLALASTLEKLGNLPELDHYDLSVLAVDDGSSEAPDPDAPAGWERGRISDIRIVRLACNLGHQRAIAVGLVCTLDVTNMDAAVVMDSDGEDRPSDVPRLLSAWATRPECIVVAKRGLRKKDRSFAIFYFAYKLIFRLLTGETINFGNFSLLPRRAVISLTHNSSLWNNLAAAVSRSRYPYIRLQLDRGERLAGRSHMNFVSLALHGVSAISVYAEVVLVRLVAASCTLGIVALILAAAVLCVRLGTDLAIPGWASDIIASLTVVFLQAILLGAMSIFQLLNARSLKPFIPALDAKLFIASTKQHDGNGNFS
jgi:glycosyltransferase involved in cell wall biosynthesis